MKLLLAVNDDALENYFNNINDIEFISRVISDPVALENMKCFIAETCYIDVCCCVKHRKSFLENVLKYVPDTIIISHTLPGDEDMHKAISRLSSSKDFSTARIIYLYGSDDEDRREFISFLISNGVFDYYVGDTLTPIVLNDLLIKTKSREDVKCDIVQTFKAATEETEQIPQTTLQPYKQGDSNNYKFITQNTAKIIDALKEHRVKREEEKRIKAETVLEMRYARIFDDDYPEDVSFFKRKKNKTIFIPDKMIISIGGLVSRTGCSYVAKTIASYVAYKKKKVCIVDYKLHNDGSSTEQGIPIFPKNMIDNLFDDYDYIILDVSDKFEDRTVIPEIRRSRLKIIMASTDDDYIQKLGEFIEKYKDIGSSKWIYLFNIVPSYKVKKVDALMEDFEHYCITTESLNEDTKQIIDSIFQNCNKIK